MTDHAINEPIPEAIEYICQVCDAEFFYLEPAELVCPKCGGKGDDNLARIDEIDEEEVSK